MTIKQPVTSNQQPEQTTKAEIARHFAELGRGWNKRVYVNGRRVNRRQFLKKSAA